MGTTLTGTTPQDTYDSLIKVTDNGPLSGTAKYLSDGLGNDSTLALSTGNIGIGTTSLNSRLTVQGGDGITIRNAGDTFLQCIDTSDAGVNYLEFKGSGGATGSISYSQATDFMAFRANSAERMRIDSAGNVGIGTSSPTEKLQVVGAIQSQFGSRTLTLQTDGVNAIFDLDGGDYFFRTSGFVNRLNITSDGYVRLASGTGGLQFNGDTAAANALDDYEEGTWTMGVSFGGASVGVTTDLNTGNYTKIGRQVTVSGFLRLTSKGSSTGAVLITGLPFTIGAAIANYAAASVRLNNITFANQFQALGDVSTTSIVLQEITEAGVLTDMTNADFADNSQVIVSFTYFV